MLGPLIVLFLLLPFIDLYLLIQLTEMIGFLETLGIVFLTGIIGAAVVKREGRGLLAKLQTSVTAKEVSRNVLEGVLLAAGGLMLISPGLITDFIGIMFVWRPTRERLMLKLVDKFKDSASMRFEVRQF